MALEAPPRRPGDAVSSILPPRYLDESGREEEERHGFVVVPFLCLSLRIVDRRIAMAIVASTAPPLHMPSALLSCRGGGGGEGGATTTTTTTSCSSSSQFQKQPVVVVSSSASSSSWCISRLVVLRRSSAWSSNPRHFCRRDARRTATPKQKKMIRITSCEATGRGFDDRLGEIAAEARRRASDAARAVSGKAEDVFNDVKRKTVEFQEKNDVKGKVRNAMVSISESERERASIFVRTSGCLCLQAAVSINPRRRPQNSSSSADGGIELSNDVHHPLLVMCVRWIACPSGRWIW